MLEAIDYAIEKGKNRWRRCSEELPDCDVVVETKIDDENGCRNEGTLKRYQRSPETRSLWFVPDGSMYVYYEPTHSLASCFPITPKITGLPPVTLIQISAWSATPRVFFLLSGWLWDLSMCQASCLLRC